MTRVFGNTTLRKIFRPECNNEISGWKQLENEEIHKLHTSPIFIYLNNLV